MPSVYSLFQNWVQESELMILKQPKMGDNFRQQRQRRTDGAIRSTADRRPMGKDRSLAPETAQPSQGGRPPKDDRKVLEGILWILRSGARWQDLPEEFPSPSTCWRRLRDWEGQGVWLTIWRAFLAELNQHGQLDWGESFLDGSFASAKIGARKSEKPSGARARSGWW